MTNFLVTINSKYGLVTITDSEKDPTKSTCTILVNKECFIIVFYGIDGAKDFADKYIIPHKELQFNELIEKTTTAFNENYKNYSQKKFSLLICSYVNRMPIYHAFWIQADGKPRFEIQQRIAHYVNKIEDIVEYFRNKIYSEHMSIEELKNLAAFITVQIIKVFAYVSDFGSYFDITLLSEKGVKQLTDGEAMELFSKQDQVDHKMKKIFSDFFVREVKQ